MKKLLFLVPIIALLALACNRKAPVSSQSQVNVKKQTNQSKASIAESLRGSPTSGDVADKPFQQSEQSQSQSSATPRVAFATYFGGEGNDNGIDIAVDKNGYIYVVGQTDSAKFSSLQGTNAFVAKFDSTGSHLIYNSIIGGNGDDTGFGIAVDGLGNAYITGSTDSINFPLKNAIQSSFGGGGQDAFIAKLDSKGSLLYSTYLGGTGYDTGSDIAVDNSGDAYVIGSTDSPELSDLGNTDTFVTKFNSTGTQRTYFAVFGGKGDDTGFGIAVDNSGAAYVTGVTDSDDFINIREALQPNYGGSQDAFIGKLDPNGVLVYGSYFGGKGTDAAYAIAVDNGGSAYLTGSTDSPEFSSLGGRDVFFAKINPSGTERTQFSILGNNGDDAGFGIALDNKGNIYITGSTSSVYFTTCRALQPQFAGAQDIFVTKLDPDGSLGGQKPSYSTFYGGSDNESGFAIASDSNGAAYVTGFTSGNFPTAKPYQATSGGNGDAFILKITGN